MRRRCANTAAFATCRRRSSRVRARTPLALARAMRRGSPAADTDRASRQSCAGSVTAEPLDDFQSVNFVRRPALGLGAHVHRHCIDGSGPTVDLVFAVFLVWLDVSGCVDPDGEIVRLPAHQRIAAVPEARTLRRAVEQHVTDLLERRRTRREALTELDHRRVIRRQVVDELRTVPSVVTDRANVEALAVGVDLLANKAVVDRVALRDSEKAVTPPSISSAHSAQ